MENIPSGRNIELKKVSSEDDVFRIVALDLEGNNKQDMMLIN